MCPTTSQYPSCWHPSWLSNPCTTRKDSESEWLAKDNQEANPTTIKPETASHVAKHFSWVPLVCSLLPSNLFPNKISCFVSSYVSLDNSFPSVKQEPTRGPWKGFPIPATEDDMVWWYHWLNGHEFQQTPGDSEEQGSLACCHSWGSKGLTQLNDWETTNNHIGNSFRLAIELNFQFCQIAKT